MMRIITVACCTVLVAASCQQRTITTEAPHYTLKGDTVLVSGTSPLHQQIKLLTVTAAPYQLQQLSAGVVKAIPNNYAEIAPPFSGRVVKSYMRLGEKVTAGAPLFEISSPDFITAQKTFFQAKQLWQQAVAAQQRQQDLFKHGVGAARDLEEANTNAAVQQKEYENATAALKIFDVNPATVVLGQPLIIRSPIPGEVIDNKLVTGQFLTAGAGPVAIVAALSQVWIVGQVKEKDIRFINEGDNVNMEVAAVPDVTFTGKVFHISRVVEETSRAVEVLIICDNPAHRLKPGMYASMHFMDPPEKVITVPATAVMQQNNSGYVFVEATPGAYLRRSVQTGDADSNRVIIRSGLQPNDKIVSEGGFYLSSVK